MAIGLYYLPNKDNEPNFTVFFVSYHEPINFHQKNKQL